MEYLSRLYVDEENENGTVVCELKVNWTRECVNVCMR